MTAGADPRAAVGSSRAGARGFGEKAGDKNDVTPPGVGIYLTV